MPIIAKFRATTCCGDPIGSIDLEIDPERFADYDDWDEWDVGDRYTGEVLSALGLVQHKCQGCYDSAYRVICDCFIERDNHVESNS